MTHSPTQCRDVYCIVHFSAVKRNVLGQENVLKVKPTLAGGETVTFDIAKPCHWLSEGIALPGLTTLHCTD